MAVVITCSDCGRAYDIVDFLCERDRNGARPLQCPNCYTLIGRTTHDAADADLTAPSRSPAPGGGPSP